MLRGLAFSTLILLCCLQAKAIDAATAHTIFYSAENGKFVPEIDVYWQISPHTVHYKTYAGKMIIANIKTNIVFSNDTGIIMRDEFILQTVPRANANELVKNNITDVRRYRLPTGATQMKLRLTDLADTANKYLYSDSFIVYPHTGKEAFYSGIELLDTTIESDAATSFRKNGRQQVPSCSSFIDEHRKMLHYYAELYGTNQVAKGDFPLIQKTYITRKENDGAYDNVIKTDTITTGNISLVSGSFPIGAQVSGNYYLVISLENNVHQVIANATEFFQRLNPHPEIPPEVKLKKTAAANDTGIENINVLNLSKTFLGKYDMAQVKSILKMLLPFSDNSGTRTIEGFLKKPDDMYMRYYIYNYFAAIDKNDPARAWKDFSEKVLAVNKLFSGRGTPGYQTERGFMYLRYGPPTDVITVENEQGTLPYELWQYDVLMQTNQRSMANAVFLFYKPNQMISEYKLLHSTVPGELQNAGWRSYLYINGGGSNSNSRAEQYLAK